jgi:hypothetical protein
MIEMALNDDKCEREAGAPVGVPARKDTTMSKRQWTYEYLVSYELDGHTHVRHVSGGREADRLEIELNRRGCTRVVSSGLTFDDLARYRRDVERARQGSMVIIYDEAEV